MSNPMPLLRKAIRQHQFWISGTCVLILVAAFYLPTVQYDINGLDTLVDAGEIQNALYLWGIIHPTGYPLYLLAGGIFVHLLSFLGINPAAGASLFSLAGALATLAFFFSGVHFETRRTWIAGLITLLLAACGQFWLRSIDAEVYTWAFFFVALAFYIALRFRARPTSGLFLLLLFVLGTGIAHHRFVALLVPAILFLILPEAWPLVRARTVLLAAGAAAMVLPFTVYLYLPLRSLLGTKWAFTAADTWSGFMGLFTGRGYLESLIVLPTDLSMLAAGIGQVSKLMAAQLTWPGLVAGMLALLSLVIKRDTRWISMSLALGFATYFVFAMVYPIRDIDAYLVPATMLLLLGYALVLARVGTNRIMGPALTMAILTLTVWNAYATWPAAVNIGRDTSGRDLLNTIKSLSGPKTALVGSWGPDFFTYWYGKFVTAEIDPQTEILTPDAPITDVLRTGNQVYASSDIFYSTSLDAWDESLGHAYIQSAGAHLVQISNRPFSTFDSQTTNGLTTWGPVTLLSVETTIQSLSHSLELVLYWRANARIGSDYSVMIHLVDPSASDRIIAQADSSAPVDGFYPTSRWQPGEVVRDEHTVPLPSRDPGKLALVLGWYQQDSKTERFQDLGSIRLRLPSP